jgi:hypothetical protein
MLTNGATTVDSLSYIPYLIVVPKLFDQPREGYIAWIQSQVHKPNPISPGTIPARILQAEGEGRYWGWLLPKIITGDYERELLESQEADDSAVREIIETDSLDELAFIASLERDLPLPLQWAARAKLCRRRFESGQPLYIGMWQSTNRYKNVVPVLIYLGGNRYAVGGSQNRKQFQAKDHQQALELARLWYQEEHDREIKEAKSAARKLAVPRMVLDLLGIILEKDGVIYDEHGTRVAWKNGGIHGRFGVAAPTWCYIIKCSPPTAGLMMAAAHREAAQMEMAAAWQIDLSGKVHDYLGLTVSQQSERPITFDGGYLTAHPHKANTYGLVIGGGRPLMQIVYTPPPTPTKPARIQVLDVPLQGKTAKRVGESVSPVRWGLTKQDCLAWGTWVAGNYLRRQTRKK